jgi:hypothetical protein
VIYRSATQKFVTLSVTVAESAAGVMVAQDMLYTYQMLTSMGLQVKLPMVLEMDNKGAVDLQLERRRLDKTCRREELFPERVEG